MNVAAGWHPARHSAACVGLTDRLAALHEDFSATARRLSIVAAEREAPTTVPLKARHALARVAELRALALQAAPPANLGLAAQVEAVASVAAELAAVLRGHSHANPCPGEVGADLAGGLPGEIGLGPNETRASLILAVEILDVAARVVLALARFACPRGHVRRLAGVFAGPATWCMARVVSMLVSVDLWHHSPLAVLATAVAVVGRFAASRSARTLGDLLGVLTSAALPHAVVGALALVDLLSTSYAARHHRTGPATRAVGRRRLHRFVADHGNEIAETRNENTERREVVVSYSPGDWIELVRTVEGGSAGQRGKVTSTGFLGGLDIQLANGTRLTGVDASAVKATPASPNSGDGGCALVGLAAGVATVAAAGWTRARWGA